MSGTNGFKVVDRPMGRGDGGKYKQIFEAIVAASRDGKAIRVAMDSRELNNANMSLVRMGQKFEPRQRIRHKRDGEEVILWSEAI